MKQRPAPDHHNLDWALFFILLAGYLFFACPAQPQSFSCVTGSSVTLSGTLGSSNGLPAKNYTMTLKPSQQGFLPACQVNLPLAVTCGTSIDGSVVGIPNPLTGTVNTTSGSGSLSSGVYYSVIAWYDSTGNVTLASPETATTLSGTGSLVVNPPASGVPSNAQGMRVYIGSSSGSETLQGSTTGSASFVQSSALSGGASPSGTNTTLCQVAANDAVWPTGTGYNVTLVDSHANPVPGYPMQWQLLGPGTTVNLSNGLPYYHGVVVYPSPILSAPANHGTQSISGGLSFGGYTIYNAGAIGVGTATPGWPIDVENGKINASGGYLANGMGGTNGQCLGSDGTAFDTPQACAVIGGTPTIASLGAGAGTGATGSLSSGATDTSGTVNVTTGTTPSAGQAIWTLTFSKIYTFAFCVAQTSSLIANSLNVAIFTTVSGSNNVQLISQTGNALTASISGNYAWTYECTVR